MQSQQSIEVYHCGLHIARSAARLKAAALSVASQHYTQRALRHTAAHAKEFELAIAATG